MRILLSTLLISLSALIAIPSVPRAVKDDLKRDLQRAVNIVKRLQF